jgi:ribokinase
MTASKTCVCVVGSSNTDMVVPVDRIPRPGETVIGGRFTMVQGGKGANQAVAASRAGAKVFFIGRVGRDAFGDAAVRSLKREGIQVSCLKTCRDTPSGVALIFVARDGENSIAVASGANAILSRNDILRARSVIENSHVLVLQLETPLETVSAAASLACQAGIKIILNPAPARALPVSLLRCVSLLTPNETEAEILTGIRVVDPASAKAASRKLLGLGVGGVILTMGRRGALISTGQGQQIVPGFKVKAVDTTAAGDVFNGALAVALGEGQSLAEGVRFANAAAAISVTRFGAQPSAPPRAEIERFLANRSESRG